VIDAPRVVYVLVALLHQQSVPPQGVLCGSFGLQRLTDPSGEVDEPTSLPGGRAIPPERNYADLAQVYSLALRAPRAGERFVASIAEVRTHSAGQQAAERVEMQQHSPCGRIGSTGRIP